MDADGDDDDAPLQRTVKHAAAPTAHHTMDQPSSIPLESLQSLRPPAQDEQRVTVKNTFLHVDDALKRADSDEPLLRALSAPSGPIRQPSPPRRASDESLQQQPITEEGEEQEDEDEDYDEDAVEDADDERLQTALTYDPFAAFSPLAAGYGHLGFPPVDAPASSSIESPWTSMQPLAYSGFDMASPWGFSMPMEGLPLADSSADYPPAGALHCFHTESHGFGTVSPDLRQFTKGTGYEGRLSVLSEAQVHRGGLHRYLVQFTYGELSKADGVGFVFASRLPCTKNIQKIVSVFLKQGGQIAMRVFGEVVRASGHVRPIQIGDWVEMDVDLDKSCASFKIWPCHPIGGMPIPGKPDSSADFNFGKKLSKALSKPVDLTVGHFACVIQNVGTTVTIGS